MSILTGMIARKRMDPVLVNSNAFINGLELFVTVRWDYKVIFVCLSLVNLFLLSSLFLLFLSPTSSKRPYIMVFVCSTLIVIIV